LRDRRTTLGLILEKPSDLREENNNVHALASVYSVRDHGRFDGCGKQCGVRSAMADEIDISRRSL
jgi:hypothetical protein